jgi:hypothetical protein
MESNMRHLGHSGTGTAAVAAREIEITTLDAVLSSMIEEQMPDHAQQDTFTITDRKELMRQGLQLEGLTQDMMDLKVLFNEAIKVNEEGSRESKTAAEIIKTGMEVRLRSLEDERLVLKTQLRTFLIVASLIGGAVGTGVELMLRVWFK